MIDISEALQTLRLGAEWALINNELEWLDENQTQPTTEEIEAEMLRLQEEYDAQEYARLRKEEYPSIEDQLDTIYHSGLDVWYSKIKEVKDKFPKGVL